MKTIQIGGISLKATQVGLGCWQAGKRGWGDDYTDDQIIDAMKFYIKSDGNYLDTAEIYGLGHSETLIAQALSEIPRNKYIIATKINPPHVKNYKTMEMSLKGSLKRLNVDYIDLYQLHWYEPNVPMKEIMMGFEKFQAEGWIREIGVCNLSAPVLKDAVKAMKDSRIVSNQMEYSLLERNVERELIPYMKEEKMTVIAYSPLAKGLLTGKYDRNFVPADNIRQGDELFNNPENRKIMEPLLKFLKHKSEEKNCTMAQLSLSYLMHKGALIIPGAKNSDQVKQNLGSESVTLSKSEVEEMDVKSNLEFIYA